MSRRIDIELTSHSDGTWTWRAAGAKQPKGSLPEDMVPGSASVGDVLRAEVERGIEGIEVVSLAAKVAKVDERPANRIEVIGVPRRGPDVVLVSAGGGRRRGGDDRPHRREGGPRRDGGPRREDTPRGDGAPRRDGTPRREGGPRREDTASRDGEPRRDAGGRRPGADGSERRVGGPRERERKPIVSTVHRNAMLATLGPEQLPVAEQLLRGGIAAVRSAIAEQHRGSDTASANADPLLAIAEQLLPAVNLASWKDRATAAQASGKDLRLRELRAVVTASRTVTLDDDGRVLAKALRDALDHRVTVLRDDWIARLTAAVESGRAADAVRTASRPPEPSTRLPAELAVRVAEVAGAAMTAETDEGEWLQLLQAVVDSPVRRTVRPAGIPGGPEAQQAALHAAGLVPELAKLLGLRIPPPPPRRVLSRAGGGGAPAVAR